MQAALGWALARARRHTLRLAAGIAPDDGCRQAFPGEHHPTWTIGHLLLGDTYLLFLLEGAELGGDFQLLLTRYGPTGAPTADGSYDPLPELVERLDDTGAARQRIIGTMSPRDFARPMPDAVLARAQPTIGHHLEALLCHEGYHAGQLAAWRRGHGYGPSRWELGPEGA